MVYTLAKKSCLFPAHTFSQTAITSLKKWHYFGGNSQQSYKFGVKTRKTGIFKEQIGKINVIRDKIGGDVL